MRFIVRGSSFDRWELLSAIVVSLLIAYWVNTLVAVSTSKADRKLEAAETRLAELEERNRDRHLSPEQRAGLLALLRNGPTGNFIVKVASNRESQNFADEVAGVMVEAGWVRVRRETMIGAASAGFGVVATRNDIPRGVLLYNSLKAVGLPLLSDIWPNKPPDTVILFVGEKP